MGASKQATKLAKKSIQVKKPDLKITFAAFAALREMPFGSDLSGSGLRNKKRFILYDGRSEARKRFGDRAGQRDQVIAVGVFVLEE